MLIGVAAWIGIPHGARAESPRAEIAAAGLLFPEGTIFVGSDLYFVDFARSDVLLLIFAEN